MIWHGRAEELCANFKDGRVDCVITDPPFGTDNLSHQSTTPHGKEYARKIEGDLTPEEAIKTFQRVMEVLLPKTRADCDFYTFTSYQVLGEWLVMLDQFMPIFGFERKATIIWAKDGPGMGDLNCPWGMGIEFINFFQKGAREKHTKRRTSVLHVSQVRPSDLIHPHQKPVALLEHFIKASTHEGDFIVDPFAGSGSTVRAARSLNRNAVGIEYNEKNYKLAKEKLETQEDGMF